VVQLLCDYSGLSLTVCKEIWHKEQMVSLLLDLREAINYCDESGDIWESYALEELLSQVHKIVEAGSFLQYQQSI
jgi:hypothetical protein